MLCVGESCDLLTDCGSPVPGLCSGGTRCDQSQDHGLVWVGRDLEGHLVPNPPAMGRDIFHQPRVLRAPSNLALSTAREGAATASLGNLGQGLTTLMGKNFFLIPDLNLPSFSLQPFSLVLTGPGEKSFSSFFMWKAVLNFHPEGFLCAIRSAQAALLLLQDLC